MTIQDIQELPTKEERIETIRELFYSGKINIESYKALIFRFS